MEKLTLLLLASFVPLVVALCYMTPAEIALRRHHPQSASIRRINLLFGWTVIGWAVALVWSLNSRGGATPSLPGFGRANEPRLGVVSGAMNEVWAEVEMIGRKSGNDVGDNSPTHCLMPGDHLRLVRADPADTPAVRVCLDDGHQVGVLTPDLAARVAMNLDANRPVDCRVLAVTGEDGTVGRLEAVLVFHVLRSAAPRLTSTPSGAMSATGSN